MRPFLGHGGSDASLLQIADALILFDTPLLDQRFQEAIAMHPKAGVRAVLESLPPKVAKGSRLTRRAAIEWERVTGGSALDEEFRLRSERFLLEAFLESAEQQIRLKAFMSRHAPTREVRDLIEAAIGVHRELVTALREALRRLADLPAPPSGTATGTFVGPSETGGDLRGEVERAILAMRARGVRPRVLLLSPVALRHLRDQGLFARGEAEVEGVSVQVDLAWGDERYAVVSAEAVPLEEMRGEGSAEKA